MVLSWLPSERSSLARPLPMQSTKTSATTANKEPEESCQEEEGEEEGKEEEGGGTGLHCLFELSRMLGIQCTHEL